MTPLRNLSAAGRGKCVASPVLNPPTAVHTVARPAPCARPNRQPLQQQTAPLVPLVPCSSRQVVAQAAAATIVLGEDTTNIAQPTPPPEPKVEVEGVVVLPVVSGIKCLRGVCNERLKYEVEYSLKKGTSENSYLLSGTSGGQKYNVLIDVPFKAFADDFLPALRGEVPLNQLTHIALTHMGPNRLPTLKAVLEGALQGRPAGSPLKLVVTNPAKAALQKGLADVLSAAGSAIEFVVPKDGSISITEKYSLTAVLTPTPRWPDAMCIIDPSSKVVFSSKFFSAHVAPGQLNGKAKDSAFDVGGWDTYGDHWRYFFDCMLAPMASQAQSALEKLPVTATPRASLDTPNNFMSSVMKSWTSMVAEITAGSKEAKGGYNVVPARLFAYALAPQHGPVIRTSLSHLSAEYRKWVQDQIAAAKTSNVVVMYASAYGNTAALAQAISRGVVKSGVAVKTVNLEVTPLDDVVAAVKQSDGFTIGSPTLGGHMPTPVQLALGSILGSGGARELPCGVFGSFGWSGEAVDEMESKLKDGGYGFAFQPIKVKFKPTTKDLSTCEQSGRDLAVQVKRRMKTKEQGSMGSMAAVTASGPQLAMGRVVGSLCVVTAKDEDYATGMIATWVSQASFDPPGITVSVKKDRTLETMLQPGNAFAVSMVTEQDAKRTRKIMSKPFTPGADRLANLKTHPSPLSQTPVLDTANAILDCTVVSRMEAGDHWVVYGQVNDGVLQSATELTAVMHRKVGNYY